MRTYDVVQQLSSYAKELMSSFGWSSTRSLNDIHMEKWLVVSIISEPLPIKIYPSAYEILSNMGGLTIGYHSENSYFPIVFEPTSEIVKQVQWWYGYQWMLDENLFPLGYFGPEGEEEVIALSQNGKIYGIDSIAPGVLLLGENIADAINNIVRGDIFIRLHTQIDSGSISIVNRINCICREEI